MPKQCRSMKAGSGSVKPRMGQAAAVRRVARAAAEEAAAYLQHQFTRPRAIRHKGLIDLVTDADTGAERRILACIRRAFPGDAILSEEDGGAIDPAARTWIVDPLDGTTNYAHGYPFYAISIGIVDRGVSQYGLVVAPAFGEWFVAERGRGARLNGRLIHVSQMAALSGAFLVTGFPYDIHETGTNLCEFSRLARRALAIRRDGAAALDLAYVACGRFEGFWEATLSPWDVAAGTVLVTEAGGRVTDWHGRRAYRFGDPLLATNGRVHAAVSRELRGGLCACPGAAAPRAAGGGRSPLSASTRRGG